jgi:hypothetical protein
MKTDILRTQSANHNTSVTVLLHFWNVLLIKRKSVKWTLKYYKVIQNQNWSKYLNIFFLNSDIFQKAIETM